MTQQAWLDVVPPQGLLQERVVIEVNLADRKIVRGSPIGVELVNQICRQRC
jgi:hypothetical protein